MIDDHRRANPVEKNPGDKVVGGSVNATGSFIMRQMIKATLERRARGTRADRGTSASGARLEGIVARTSCAGRAREGLRLLADRCAAWPRSRRRARLERATRAPPRSCPARRGS